MGSAKPVILKGLGWSEKAASPAREQEVGTERVERGRYYVAALASAASGQVGPGAGRH
jgi:hypothetical protein